MVSLFPQTLTVLWWQQLDIICYFVQVVYFRYVIEGCLCMYIPTQQLNCLFDQDRVCRLLYLLHLNPKRTQITLSRQSFGRISHCLYETIITILLIACRILIYLSFKLIFLWNVLQLCVYSLISLIWLPTIPHLCYGDKILDISWI